MKHFHRIGTGLEVLPLMHAVARQPALWNAYSLRQSFADSPHAEVDDIWLRFTDVKDKTIPVIGDDLDAVPYPAWPALPQAKAIVLNLMRAVDAVRLGRVMVTRLKPGATIKPHKDVKGAYAHYYTRYHVVLQGLPGSLFRCGNEQVCMETGEVWWFNAHEVHECVNNSADDRVHLLCDIRIE